MGFYYICCIYIHALFCINLCICRALSSNYNGIKIWKFCVAFPNRGLGMLQSGIRAQFSTLRLDGKINREHKMKLQSLQTNCLTKYQEEYVCNLFDKIITVKMGKIIWVN
jgi:hypothetical protein